jgi:hypothetical protein
MVDPLSCGPVSIAYSAYTIATALQFEWKKLKISDEIGLKMEAV